MKFPIEIFKEEKNKEKLIEVLKFNLCNNCLGRAFGMLGHGLSNYERGEILRKFASELIKKEFKEPKVCEICNNFFKEKIDSLVHQIVKKVEKIEFDTFLIGTILSDELAKNEEKLFENIGIEFVESIKSEINREVGKRVEKILRKKFDTKSPDLTLLIDLDTDNIKLQIRSLYVYGEYKKLVRGIPQSKWICGNCKGKGCVECEGRGKLYTTSVQEEIEKPLIKKTKAKKSAFHGSGREDIDVRNLGWRPFVIELIKPIKRKINLEKIQREINKSKKVKVRKLKLVDKYVIRKIKNERWDKTYLIVATFEKDIDRKKLKLLKNLMLEPISQKTPLRVLHRRPDKIRKRKVKSLSYKILSKKRLQLKIRAESGLYVKELITGDEGRTKPSVAEILDNKVKNLTMDVIKIHVK
ncbi:MAG: tRNA pseudouridine(54/55) synthase Pus10 [Candidatus Aenigmatarchaeota archaeon]